MRAIAFERRLVSSMSLALLVLAIVALVALPLRLALDAWLLWSNAAMVAGLAVACALAYWGHPRSASAVLLWSVLLGLWVVVVHGADTPEHEVYILATMVPAALAFTLGRLVLGSVAVAMTLGYVAVDAVMYEHAPGGPLAVALVFLGATGVCAIAAVLRRMERQRAAGAETGRDAAEAEARALVAELQEAQALAHIGSWELDVTSGQGKWSPEMYKLFGRDPASFAPTYTTSFESIHPDDRAAVDAGFKHCIAERRDFDMDHRIVHADGSTRFVNERGRFTYGPGGRVLRARGTTQDITERKKAEEDRHEVLRKEAELEQSKELAKQRMDFLNAVAHDLRTPLTPLRVQLATLRARIDDPELLDGVAVLERNVMRLQSLVDDLLDAASLRSGRLSVRRVTVQLAPLVEEAALAFQEPARQRGLRLDLVPHPPVAVEADPAKSVQVLLNLVSNAVKYTPPGGRVRVRVDGTGEETIVAIEDTGPGLTADQQAKLFQPFVRLHEGQPNAPKGTGLGLYISREIMQLQGGRLWVESDGAGRGATFKAAWRSAPTSAETSHRTG